MAHGIKSMVSLKMSILQIWVTWASKITVKNLQLCNIKVKGSHTPCDIAQSHSITLSKHYICNPLEIGIGNSTVYCGFWDK